jgi:hypothetical protein
MASVRDGENIHFEGACCYAVQKHDFKGDGRFEIRIFSTNCVVHLAIGLALSHSKAERICARLNAYPRQTRQAHGLL